MPEFFKRYLESLTFEQADALWEWLYLAIPDGDQDIEIIDIIAPLAMSRNSFH